MAGNLEPLIQDTKNRARQDREGVARNLGAIQDLYNRIEELRRKNVFLEKRAREYDEAVRLLEYLQESLK